MTVNKCMAVMMAISLVFGLCMIQPNAIDANEGGTVEFISNGGFEAYTGNTPQSWLKSGNATFGSELTIDATVGRDGNAALKMQSSGGSIYLNQRISGLVAGNPYTFSTWLKRGAPSPGANVTQIKFEYAKVVNGVQMAVDGGAHDHSIRYTAADGSWTPIEEIIFLPDTATIVNIMLRVTNVGVMYWDDVSLTGQPTPERAAFMSNGDFEAYTGHTPDGWSKSSNASFGNELTIVAAGGKDGSAALKMQSSGASIYVNQRISGLVSGGRYTLSAWLKRGSPAPGTNITQIKFEYSTMVNGVRTAVDGGAHDQTIRYTAANGDWNRIEETIVLPDTATIVNVLLRVTNAGVMYWDDVAFTGEPAPEPTEQMVNGGFDSYTGNTPDGWSKSGNASFGNELTISPSGGQDGSASLKMHSSGASIYVNQRMSNLESGGQYILSARLKRGTPAPGTDITQIKLEYSRLVNGVRESVDGGAHDKTIRYTAVNGDWAMIEQTIVLPDTATIVNVMLRVTNAGIMEWDNVSFKGASQPAPEALPSANLVGNSSFELLEGNGLPQIWKAAGAGNQYVSMDNGVFNSGSKSVKISTASGGNPWVRQMIPVKPNTEYQVKAWVRQSGLAPGSRDVRFKFEYYTSDVISSATWIEAARVSGGLTPEEHQWTQVEQTFTTPPGAQYLNLYARLHANGTVWFDDVQLAQMKSAPRIVMETDDVFYYEDRNTGVARVDVGLDQEQLGGATVDFRLKDGHTVLQEQTGSRVTPEGSAYFQYDLSLLAQTKKAYDVEAILRNGRGTAVEVIREDIYRYNRPTVLTDEGLYMDGAQVFIPTLVYHPNRSTYDVAEEMGMNLMQITYGVVEEWARGNETLLWDTLDDLETRGWKGIVCLYAGMKAASHPDNAATTMDIVNSIKNHPAVYGYAVIDEPFSQIPNPEFYLKEAYKMIRNIDDVHPVYVLDANDTEYKLAAKYADVLVHDPYPTSSHEAATFVQNMSDMARAAVARNNKPFLTVNQAFTYGGYTPTADELRNMWYQSLLAGAKGNGYYSFPLMRAIPGVETGVKQFALAEQALSYDLFAYGGHQNFNDYKNDEYLYKSVVSNGDVYMLVLNRNTSSKTVSVSLKSNNGKVSAAGGTIVGLYGAAGTNPVVAGSQMSVALGSRQAALFKISGVTINQVQLAASAFNDLSSYGWAAAAIDDLFAKGIVNAKSEGKYEPGQAVTRADFAMFLMRTLDIDLGNHRMEPNYSDVASHAYYAREVAIGKTLGLFHDVVTGNAFNPDASLTRQDMMLISARALRLKMVLGGDASISELAAFSDSGSIAVYAKLAVAQMVKAGFVEGNSNGTISPNGSVSRAEAAVLMSALADSLAE